MLDVAFYSLIELLTGFSTSVTMLLVLRRLFGIGMGGEWGAAPASARSSATPWSSGASSTCWCS
jgi:MFS transporter, SHS family, lactate transporter